MAEIHQFNHRAMATYFEVRIADEERAYAAQAAQAALDLLDKLESFLSRFRAHSDVAQIAELEPGETMRLSEPAFACLEIAKKMELATGGAFSATAAALQTQAARPQWSLLPGSLPSAARADDCNSIWAPSARGLRWTAWQKLLREWDCPAFCWWPGAAASWPARRRRKPMDGRAAWATTMRRSDFF